MIPSPSSRTVPTLLVLSPAFPYPPASGGDIRIYQLLRRLARSFEIHVLAAGDGPDGADQLLVDETGIAAIYCRREEPRQSLAWQLTKRIDFWRGSPHNISLHVDPALVRTLQGIQSKTRFDAVLIDHLYMLQYARFVRPAPVFFSATDVETIKYMRWYADEPATCRRRVWRWAQRTVIRRYESRLGQKADVTFATSDSDRDFLQRMNRTGRFVVAGNGVDLDYFSPRQRESFNQPPAILFVGTMFYKPNYQAVRFLLREVFPRVRRQIPEATCHLVGKTMDHDFAELHQPDAGVFMHGYVPDIRPYLQRCQTMAVPLFIGSGTRIKILETMASGTPVVSSSVGAEGLRCLDGENIVIADSADDFASAIVSLLLDRDRCRRIGAAGRRLVEKEYTWDASAETIRREIAQVLERRSLHLSGS